MDWIDLAQDKDRGAGFCECGKESSGSIKCGEFIGQLRTCWHLRKDSAILELVYVMFAMNSRYFSE
jgi:hypothetical protein